LLVDDDAQSCEVARTILTNCGHALLVANNVAEALVWAASHPGPIHLLLTDIAVAETAGREIARLVCATRRDTRVLYMSSTTSPVITDQAMDAGVSFLQKPFTASALADRVRGAIDEPASRP
jgi:DNA-binding NtrC family response regulator